MAAIDHLSLVKAMDKSGISKRQLAEATGLSLQYICDITAGRRRLKRNPGMRVSIAQALDVPLHWIESRDAA